MKRTVINGFIKLGNLLLESKIALIIFVEIVVGIAFSLSSTALFVDLSTEIFDRDTLYYDQTVSRFIYSFRTPFFTQIMIFITNLGQEYLLIILAVVIILLVWKKYRKEALLFIILFLMGIVINSSLKILFHRPRPLISPLISVGSYSYPSGHAMNSFIFYITLAFYFYHFTRKRRQTFYITIAAVILVLLIGFSRVYLGVHYPTDILAGYFVGFWCFVTALVIEKTLDLLKIFKSNKNII